MHAFFNISNKDTSLKRTIPLPLELERFHCIILCGCKPAGASVGTTGTSQWRTPATSGSASRQPMRAVHHHYQPPSSGSTNRPVWFYNRDEPYYEFTNFFHSPIKIDGKSWPTTEHYFQAQKFVGTPYVEKIRMLPGPRDAFQLSRDPAVSRWRRGDWERVKDDVMLKALRVKFTENVGLREKLRETGERELVEHTSNDSYWGDGGNGLGQNKLGKLLMQVRRELKEKYGPYTPAYHLSTRDDTSISHRPTSTFTQPRLRRSNSLSNISASRPPLYPPLYPPPTHHYAATGTSTRTTSRLENAGKQLTMTIEKTVGSVKKTVKNTVSSASSHTNYGVPRGRTSAPNSNKPATQSKKPTTTYAKGQSSTRV